MMDYDFKAIEFFVASPLDIASCDFFNSDDLKIDKAQFFISNGFFTLSQLEKRIFETMDESIVLPSDINERASSFIKRLGRNA